MSSSSKNCLKQTLEKLKFMNKSPSKNINPDKLPSSPPHNLQITANLPDSLYYKIVKYNKGIGIKTFRRKRNHIGNEF